MIVIQLVRNDDFTTNTDEHDLATNDDLTSDLAGEQC